MMEFSFKYYDWLKVLNEDPAILIFVSIFGSVIFLIALGLVRWLLGLVGLKFISNWKFLDGFMISLGINGFFGGFLLLLLVALLEASNTGMGGVRLLLIWVVLFICISVFYITNNVTLRKWFDDIQHSKSRSKKR